MSKVSVSNEDADRKQLFIVDNCFALIATSIAFFRVGDVTKSLKTYFVLYI